MGAGHSPDVVPGALIAVTAVMVLASAYLVRKPAPRFRAVILATLLAVLGVLLGWLVYTQR